MAVADGFSAMTTDRPYRSGMSSDEAISILINGSGSQWDPEIVDVLVKNWTLQAA
jgi:HD-GYP domain-containing protein (c-di-GMP phosphodiesterase class II)